MAYNDDVNDVFGRDISVRWAVWRCVNAGRRVTVNIGKTTACRLRRAAHSGAPAPTAAALNGARRYTVRAAPARTKEAGVAAS